MPRYLVDTTTLIDFSKGMEPVVRRLPLLMVTDEVGICDVVATEFFTGVAPADRERWRAFFTTLVYWSTPVEAAIHAGEERYTLARQGIQISTPDALIAATARAHGAIIITDNARHFPNTTTISLR